MALFGSREGCWTYLEMTREPKLSHSKPAQKRQHDGSLYLSCEYQKIPPLINRIPVKTRQRHLEYGNKTSLGSPQGLRSNSSATTVRTKLRAEEVHSIKGELSQIKAQVDSLLESLDRMDQQREHSTASASTGSVESKKKAPTSAEASYLAGDSVWRKARPAKDGRAALQDFDSAEESTDTEEAARNHTLALEGSP